MTPKPCPFCGTSQVRTTFGQQANLKVYQVICNCGASGPWTGILEGHDEAIKLWNNRPVEDDLRELIRHLEYPTTTLPNYDHFH